MTDTTKRNAMRDNMVELQDLADDLHDELVRLRELAIKERATVMRQAEELTRLRAILAALREPSEAVKDAAWCEARVSIEFDDMRNVTRAAVAAAEREVDA